jgi:hypothetical protein
MTETTSPGAPRCPSELTLERLRQGELTGDLVLRAHTAGCPLCQRTLEALAAPPPPMAFPRPRARFFALPALGVMAVAAAALVLVLRPREETISKGAGWQLSVIALAGDGKVRRVEAGARLRPGDRLRFEVFTRGPRAEVALVSLDAAGTVSSLVPAAGDTVPVPAGRRTLLDGAVELDDTLGAERILLVACPRARPVAEVAAAARQALARARGDAHQVNDLGLGCEQTSLWIEKVKR